MPGGPGGPDQAPPSEEDRASEGARVVASKEQHPCIDKAGVEVRLERLLSCHCETCSSLNCGVSPRLPNVRTAGVPGVRQSWRVRRE
eukprot:COSAG02_NODE_4960_length_4780_cov_21.899167_4_plen_87_part_00